MSQGLFNPREIHYLMAAEFDRSVRFGTPLAFLQIGVDRLGYLHDLYGEDSRQEILSAINELLRASTRASDLLGYPEGDRILAAVPHIEGEHADMLAERLVSGARGLTFEADGRTLRITVSIGLTHTADGTASFAKMVQDARDAVDLASVKGGDRFHRVSADPQAELELPMGSPATAPNDTQFRDALLAESLNQALSGEGGHALLAQELLGKIMDEVESRFENTSGSDSRHELLERRVAKLGDMLSRTESQLRSVLSSKGPEGVASIYQDVQGLDQSESNVGQKKDLLTAIFDANLRMKKIIEEDKSSSNEE
ncbi:MAG: diguanylate cyclase (GGDEF)-like protein [Planctomycetota bacterium]|jgi:diguanylate cyclase (GGDEF)-like protein